MGVFEEAKTSPSLMKTLVEYQSYHREGSKDPKDPNSPQERIIKLLVKKGAVFGCGYGYYPERVKPCGVSPFYAVLCIKLCNGLLYMGILGA